MRKSANSQHLLRGAMSSLTKGATECKISKVLAFANMSYNTKAFQLKKEKKKEKTLPSLQTPLKPLISSVKRNCTLLSTKQSIFKVRAEGPYEESIGNCSSEFLLVYRKQWLRIDTLKPPVKELKTKGGKTPITNRISLIKCERKGRKKKPSRSLQATTRWT